MSIRRYNKNHLPEHAGVALATHEMLEPPDTDDPLRFWTQHPRENTLIDLHIFAEGQSEKPILAGLWSGPFSGRPRLIRQLTPVIQAELLGTAELTALEAIKSLRAWWRLLDAVEAAAKNAGQAMARVEDVRLLTDMHREAAHRSGMRRTTFNTLRRYAGLTLTALGARRLYWNAPEDPEPKRHLPTDEQTKALRIALKQAWDKVRQRWALADRFRASAIEPDDENDVQFYHHVRHFAEMQAKYGKTLPSAEELRDGKSVTNFYKSTSLELITMRATAFPTRSDVDAAYHQALVSSGWNPATLLALDATQPILRSHPKNPARFVISPESYELVGTKARAGGAEQMIFGLWKNSSGPGFIIKTWLERTAPLRQQLREMLAEARARYAETTLSDIPTAVREAEFERMTQLEIGCRSIWLYVDRYGEIGWLENRTLRTPLLINGKLRPYLSAVLFQLNAERSARKEPAIPPVTASDFRDMFAAYVYRQSGGNILAVMWALRHKHVNTSVTYVDSNILNAEHDAAARNFLNHLFAELEAGRVDLTILAHLQRHGKPTPEMEQRLMEYRKLQRSRINIACKDPFHPPSAIQPASESQQMCGPQRCLLCKSHAVVMSDSMPGIALRVEELLAIQQGLPVDGWAKSSFQDELDNGLAILALFSPDKVTEARQQWAQAIISGTHRVPGLFSEPELSEAV
ncbi:MAG: hypothetical protein WBK19_20510 [Azonexus sp.]